MNIKIRPIERRDNPKVAKMIRDVFDEYNAIKEGTVYEDPTTDNLYDLFLEEKAILYVAEKDGEIHGCCGIYPTVGLPEGHVELVKFYVSSEIRGRGYGRELFQKCEDSAIDFGYDQLYIESMDDFREAVDMYKKMGFITLDKAMGSSGHFGCDIWMLKMLS
jgi:putative acetyltransferase